MWLDHQEGVTSTIFFFFTSFAKQINENSNEHYGINNLPQPIFEVVGKQVNVSNETNSAYLHLPRLVESLYWFDRNMILTTELFSRVLETFSHFSILFVA